MKAISVQQPWANMITEGQKTIETRTWKTNYRGRLLIVSSKRPPIEPAGCAIAVVTLVDCRPMTSDDVDAACCPCYVGAWAWILKDIRKIHPIPVKGQLGLYEVDYDEPEP